MSNELSQKEPSLAVWIGYLNHESVELSDKIAVLCERLEPILSPRLEKKVEGLVPKHAVLPSAINSIAESSGRIKDVNEELTDLLERLEV